MSKTSRDKGKRGELELSKLFTTEGYPAKRGGFMQSRNGASEGADCLVPSLAWLHVECKRYKKGFMGSKLRAALIQAEADRKTGTIGSVWHREDNDQWFVTLEAKDLLRIVRGEFT